MSATPLPNLGLIQGYTPGEDGWGTGGFNPNALSLDALAQITLASVQLWNTPPGSPVDGGSYIVGGSPSGDFSGQAGKLAIWSTTLGAWRFYTPRGGWLACTPWGDVFQFNGTRWDYIAGRRYDSIILQGAAEGTPTGSSVFIKMLMPNANPVGLQSSSANRRRYLSMKSAVACDTWAGAETLLTIRTRRASPNTATVVNLGTVNIINPNLTGGLLPPLVSLTSPDSNYAVEFDTVEIVAPANLNGAAGIRMSLVFDFNPLFLDFYFDPA